MWTKREIILSINESIEEYNKLSRAKAYYDKFELPYDDIDMKVSLKVIKQTIDYMCKKAGVMPPANAESIEDVSERIKYKSFVGMIPPQE